jgi:hypothetical protein
MSGVLPLRPANFRIVLWQRNAVTRPEPPDRPKRGSRGLSEAEKVAVSAAKSEKKGDYSKQLYSEKYRSY